MSVSQNVPVNLFVFCQNCENNWVARSILDIRAVLTTLIVFLLDLEKYAKDAFENFQGIVSPESGMWETYKLYDKTNKPKTAEIVEMLKQ